MKHYKVKNLLFTKISDYLITLNKKKRIFNLVSFQLRKLYITKGGLPLIYKILNILYNNNLYKYQISKKKRNLFYAKLQNMRSLKLILNFSSSRQYKTFFSILSDKKVSKKEIHYYFSRNVRNIFISHYLNFWNISSKMTNSNINIINKNNKIIKNIDSFLVGDLLEIKSSFYLNLKKELLYNKKILIFLYYLINIYFFKKNIQSLDWLYFNKSSITFQNSFFNYYNKFKKKKKSAWTRIKWMFIKKKKYLPTLRPKYIFKFINYKGIKKRLRFFDTIGINLLKKLKSKLKYNFYKFKMNNKINTHKVRFKNFQFQNISTEINRSISIFNMFFLYKNMSLLNILNIKKNILYTNSILEMVHFNYKNYKKKFTKLYLFYKFLIFHISLIKDKKSIKFYYYYYLLMNNFFFQLNLLRFKLYKKETFSFFRYNRSPYIVFKYFKFKDIKNTNSLILFSNLTEKYNFNIKTNSITKLWTIYKLNILKFYYKNVILYQKRNLHFYFKTFNYRNYLLDMYTKYHIHYSKDDRQFNFSNKTRNLQLNIQTLQYVHNNIFKKMPIKIGRYVKENKKAYHGRHSKKKFRRVDQKFKKKIKTVKYYKSMKKKIIKTKKIKSRKWRRRKLKKIFLHQRNKFWFYKRSGKIWDSKYMNSAEIRHDNYKAISINHKNWFFSRNEFLKTSFFYIDNKLYLNLYRNKIKKLCTLRLYNIKKLFIYILRLNYRKDILNKILIKIKHLVLFYISLLIKLNVSNINLIYFFKKFMPTVNSNKIYYRKKISNVFKFLKRNKLILNKFKNRNSLNNAKIFKLFKLKSLNIKTISILFTKYNISSLLDYLIMLKNIKIKKISKFIKIKLKRKLKKKLALLPIYNSYLFKTHHSYYYNMNTTIYNSRIFYKNSFKRFFIPYTFINLSIDAKYITRPYDFKKENFKNRLLYHLIKLKRYYCLNKETLKIIGLIHSTEKLNTLDNFKNIASKNTVIALRKRYRDYISISNKVSLMYYSSNLNKINFLYSLSLWYIINYSFPRFLKDRTKFKNLKIIKKNTRLTQLEKKKLILYLDKKNDSFLENHVYSFLIQKKTYYNRINLPFYKRKPRYRFYMHFCTFISGTLIWKFFTEQFRIIPKLSRIVHSKNKFIIKTYKLNNTMKILFNKKIQFYNNSKFFLNYYNSIFLYKLNFNIFTLKINKIIRKLFFILSYYLNSVYNYFTFFKGNIKKNKKIKVKKNMFSYNIFIHFFFIYYNSFLKRFRLNSIFINNMYFLFKNSFFYFYIYILLKFKFFKKRIFFFFLNKEIFFFFYTSSFFFLNKKRFSFLKVSNNLNIINLNKKKISQKNYLISKKYYYIISKINKINLFYKYILKQIRNINKKRFNYYLHNYKKKLNIFFLLYKKYLYSNINLNFFNYTQKNIFLNLNKNINRLKEFKIKKYIYKNKKYLKKNTFISWFKVNFFLKMRFYIYTNKLLHLRKKYFYYMKQYKKSIQYKANNVLDNFKKFSYNKNIYNNLIFFLYKKKKLNYLNLLYKKSNYLNTYKPRSQNTKKKNNYIINELLFYLHLSKNRKSNNNIKKSNINHLIEKKKINLSKFFFNKSLNRHKMNFHYKIWNLTLIKFHYYFISNKNKLSFFWNKKKNILLYLYNFVFFKNINKIKKLNKYYIYLFNIQLKKILNSLLIRYIDLLKQYFNNNKFKKYNIHFILFYIKKHFFFLNSFIELSILRLKFNLMKNEFIQNWINKIKKNKINIITKKKTLLFFNYSILHYNNFKNNNFNLFIKIKMYTKWYRKKRQKWALRVNTFSFLAKLKKNIYNILENNLYIFEDNYLNIMIVYKEPIIKFNFSNLLDNLSNSGSSHFNQDLTLKFHQYLKKNY
jgi:hypothetical protein